MRLHDDIFGWVILALGLLEVVAIALASKDYSDVTFVDRRLQCAGMNRHEAEEEESSRERSSDPLGPEFCASPIAR